MQVQLEPTDCFNTDSTCSADEIRQDLVKHDEIMVASEKLLRIALFSDELPMRNEAGLTARRQKLAGTIRAFRKKGVIPVFVSTLWFLVALAISIESTFGNRGTNVGFSILIIPFADLES